MKIPFVSSKFVPLTENPRGDRIIRQELSEVQFLMREPSVMDTEDYPFD